MNKEDLIKSLENGDIFQFAADIAQYKDWYYSLKYSDVRIRVHPYNPNAKHQCQMYVLVDGSNRVLVLGHPSLEDILKYINTGNVKPIK